MTEKQVARFLIEAAAQEQINPKISVFVNRLLLRLFSQPSLMAFLTDASYYRPNAENDTPDEDEDQEEETVRLKEDSASPLVDQDDDDDDNDEGTAPEDDDDDGEKSEDQEDTPKSKDTDEMVVIQLDFKRLPQEVLSPLMRLIAAPRQPKLYKFVKDGSARTGIALMVRPSDFPGDEYDYAL